MTATLFSVEQMLPTLPQQGLMQMATAVFRLMSVHSVEPFIGSRDGFQSKVLAELLDDDGLLRDEYRVVAIHLMRRGPFMGDPQSLCGCLLQFAALTVAKATVNEGIA